MALGTTTAAVVSPARMSGCSHSLRYAATHSTMGRVPRCMLSCAKISLAAISWSGLPALWDDAMPLWQLDVAFRLLPLRKLGRPVRNLFVGDAAKNMCDAVETRPLLVVRRYDVPRRSRSIRRLQHGIAHTRIVIPAAVRLQVHKAQLPALGWILNACDKALVLLLFRNIEPVLQQDNALANEKALKGRTVFKKLPVFFVGTKSHYALNPGPVIPAPLKNDDDASIGRLHPLLKFYKFHLQLEEFGLVFLCSHLLLGIATRVDAI